MNLRSLVKKLVPTGLFHKVEPLGHLVEAILAQLITGFPARKLKVIGVTGTDGKTSTCTLIAQMLRYSGKKTAMLTTISFDLGDGLGEQPNPTRLTTSGALPLAKMLKRIKLAGAEYLVLETTSHALAQHRVWGIPFHIVVMTNLSHEHLDYHGTFERYLAAKKMLFKHADHNNKGLRIGFVNAEDSSADAFASAISKSIRYGVKQGDLRATKIKLTPAGSRYVATLDNREYHISCHIPGSFNVMNSLVAVGIGHVIGLTKEQIEKGIASLSAVEGRMARVDEGQDFSVIVDYAHTPDSFRKIFEEVRPLTTGRLIVVFGSAGRRDEAKRAAQGEVAGKYGDIIIVTEEDDRDMDGQEIMEQIASGAENAGKVRGIDLFLIHKREEAVFQAITMAQKGDMVILLGKGHEKSILSNGPKAAELCHMPQNDNDPARVSKHDYDEVAVARRALLSRKS